MSAYHQAVYDTRRFVSSALDAAYAPFTTWNDLQKLILIMGVVAFVGYVAARPPRRRVGRDVEVNHFPILVVVTLAAAFILGMLVIPSL